MQSICRQETFDLLPLYRPLSCLQTSHPGVYAGSGIEGEALFPSDQTLIFLYSVGAPNAQAFTSISNMNRDTFDVSYSIVRSSSSHCFYAHFVPDRSIFCPDFLFPAATLITNRHLYQSSLKMNDLFPRGSNKQPSPLAETVLGHFSRPS